MSKITEFDENFVIEQSIKKQGMKFFDVKNSSVKIYGVFEENGKFRRIPENVAKSINKGVYAFHTCTAGGRIRFKTDSKKIAIATEMENVPNSIFCAKMGYCGFDLYVKDENGDNYRNSFIPPNEMTDGYESMYEFETSVVREITINMPTYSDVVSLYIGIDETATIEKPTSYLVEKPIVYYGSSITQGGCASRPGITYQGHISRRFDCDYINLGFSGSATAEDEIVKYICNLDMSIFVLDYDENAPDADYLEATHQKMFKAVRSAHPDIPIIILPFPMYMLNEKYAKREKVVRKTYQEALLSGDKNVYYISGKELMKYAKNEGTIDNCHPNDLGFASIAKVLGDLIENEGLLK